MTLRLLLLFLLCVGVKSLFSQNNIIKGRIIGLPGDKPKVFSLGIGYERFLNERISAQLLFNRYAFDQSSTDGSSTYTTAIVPELRGYFQNKISVNKAFYWAVFVEFQFIDSKQGFEETEPVPGTVQIFRDPNSSAINPGVLFGKNFRLSDKWYIEAYLGPKFFIEHETYIYQYPDGQREEKQERNGRLGIRAGMNVAYRF